MKTGDATDVTKRMMNGLFTELVVGQIFCTRNQVEFIGGHKSKEGAFSSAHRAVTRHALGWINKCFKFHDTAVAAAFKFFHKLL